MDERIKYRVEIRSQPLSAEQEAEMIQELEHNFPVTRSRVRQDGRTIELISPHRLAQGALEDLAYQIGESLAQRRAPLQAGVINQIAPNPVGRTAAAAIEALERQVASQPRLKNLFRRLAALISNLDRQVPVFYFYWGSKIDLALAANLRRPASLELADDLT